MRLIVFVVLHYGEAQYPSEPWYFDYFGDNEDGSGWFSAAYPETLTPLTCKCEAHRAAALMRQWLDTHCEPGDTYTTHIRQADEHLKQLAGAGDRKGALEDQ